MLRHSRSVAGAAASVIGILAVLGCGSSVARKPGNAAAQIRQIIVRAESALRRRDFATACEFDVPTTSASGTVSAAVRRQFRGGPPSVWITQCKQLFHAATSISDPVRPVAATVVVRGDMAVVRSTSPGLPERTVKLINLGGAWRVILQLGPLRSLG